jgi:hypothetical protein
VPAPELPLTGGCLCGGVRFELSEPLLGGLYCHCKRCQRRSGSGFSATGLAAPRSFRVVSGDELVSSWDPGDGGWIKSFCGECGSQLFIANAEDPSRIGVRLGALDGDSGIHPGAHQFTAYAPAWAPVPDDGLPRFPERFPAAAIPGA